MGRERGSRTGRCQGCKHGALVVPFIRQSPRRRGAETAALGSSWLAERVRNDGLGALAGFRIERVMAPNPERPHLNGTICCTANIDRRTACSFRSGSGPRNQGQNRYRNTAIDDFRFDFLCSCLCQSKIGLIAQPSRRPEWNSVCSADGKQEVRLQHVAISQLFA
jgi:hypothetical protein